MRNGGERVALGTIAREWLRIGLTGFGGPPAHIALLRRLVVERRGWMSPQAFEDAIAACNLLPGPASTQLAIFCAYRVGGPSGAVVGGLGFVLPAVVMILALSVVFLAEPSYAKTPERGRARLRWLAYVVLGAASGALLGAYLVLVLLACGAVELV